MEEEPRQHISITEALEIASNQQKVDSASRSELEIILEILEDEDRRFALDRRSGYRSQHVGCQAEIERVSRILRNMPSK